MSKITVTLIVVTLCGLGSDPSKWKVTMEFPEAAKPYESAGVYNVSGYVNKKGKVVLASGAKRKDPGLGCSSYASAVLHRMRWGKEWLKKYDLTVHQKYGDVMAAHFGLAKTADVAAKDLLDKAKTKSLVDAKKLAAGLYFFNVRKGVAGHVGFLLVKADGRLVQSHFSGMKAYDGLATGDFRKWFGKSKYRGQSVELYSLASS